MNVPVGLATKLGIVAAALSAIVAAVTAILNGDHSAETFGAILVAGSSVYAVVTGRSAQAAAAISVYGLPQAMTPAAPIMAGTMGPSGPGMTPDDGDDHDQAGDPSLEAFVDETASVPPDAIDSPDQTQQT